MSNYFYLKNETTSETLDLGTTVTELSFGGNKRNFNLNEFGSINGAYISGFGNYSPKKFSVVIPLRRASGNNTYFDLTRSTLLQWFCKATTDQIYLYVLTGDISSPKTLRTRVYCTNLSDEKIKNYHVTEKTIELISPSGVFVNTTITTYSVNIVSTGLHTLTVTNSGNIECPFILTYTPSVAATYAIILQYDNTGFKIAGTFPVSLEAIYNEDTGVFSIGGTEYNLADFLTNGSCFNLAPGAQTLNIYASNDGTIEIEFYEQFI